MEDLLPVNTTNLLEKVQAAIYLSLDELWAIPTDIALIATFLDSRFKHFKSLEKNNDDNDNLFSDLEGNFTQSNTEEEDEVSCYVKLQDIRVKNDSLM
ncbi:hypothetical protein C1646_751155 [Rhizophagus diaphanus]|nr:hypothetical protein C1646_751155 [Rhizophagus diaphanus] [Rhizophagus sp. MUCL 43196]